ncbi:HTH_Tnp_Tc3_2 domain-containing protein [Trichonephila clavipes]|nr:HTH_Tnp_Tc3_2 domain-containing protein [Trichonephila clavipes]
MFSDESRFSLQSDSRRTFKYGERQVPITTKRTPLNGTVMVVLDGSFGEELFLVPEVTCMFRVRMSSIGGYPRMDWPEKLTGLESNIACVGYAWPTNLSSSTPSRLSTGTLEDIA